MAKNGENGNSRYYSISDASRETGVAQHLLRQWEARFPQLKPKRSPTNRRYYTEKDLAIIRRLKSLMRHEGMTGRGAKQQLTRELQGEGKPRTRRELLELADRIADEARIILNILGPDTTAPAAPAPAPSSHDNIEPLFPRRKKSVTD